MKNLCFAASMLVASTACGASLYQPGVQAGTVNVSAITEASGLAASHRNPGALWTHNDSNHAAQIFALAPAGNLLGTFSLDGVTAVDFEDIAVGPGPSAGTSYIYVGDIGDNDTNRSSIRVHRIAEPLLNLGGPPTSGNLAVSTITLKYPDGPHNAESLMVDPLNGDLIIATKENSVSHVFRATFPQATSGDVTLQTLATLNGIDKATAGDISPDGNAIVLRNKTQAWQWTRPNGGSLADAFLLSSQSIVLRTETQGEALGFAFSGPAGFYTTSEETGQPIYFYAMIPEPGTATLLGLAGLVALRRRRRV